jgi:hypothetical protein
MFTLSSDGFVATDQGAALDHAHEQRPSEFHALNDAKPELPQDNATKAKTKPTTGERGRRSCDLTG